MIPVAHEAPKHFRDFICSIVISIIVKQKIQRKRQALSTKRPACRFEDNSAKSCLLTHDYMITYSGIKFNTLIQKTYEKFIVTLLLNLFQVPCSNCNKKGYLIRYGTYIRNVQLDIKKVELKVQRVRCKHCKKTHALLPDWLVPYSQILIYDMIDIIKQYEENLKKAEERQKKGQKRGPILSHIKPLNPEIDIWNIAYIIKKYLKEWKSRLRSDSISLKLEAKQLTEACFKHHDMQFMQIRDTVNSLT